jgi:hypothetical protein
MIDMKINISHLFFILKNWSKLNLDNIIEIGGHVYDYRERLKLLAKELLKVQKIKRNMNNF